MRKAQSGRDERGKGADTKSHAQMAKLILIWKGRARPLDKWKGQFGIIWASRMERRRSMWKDKRSSGLVDYPFTLFVGQSFTLRASSFGPFLGSALSDFLASPEIFYSPLPKAFLLLQFKMMVTRTKLAQQQFAFHDRKCQLLKLANFLLKLWTILTMANISRMANARPSSSFSPSQSSTSPQNSIKEMFEWLMFRNSSHYSVIAPASPESILQLNNSDQLESNGLGLTMAGPEHLEKHAASRRMRKHRHRVDSNTPFTQRAICPFQFVLNHRPNRLPATLIEVKCLSPNPSQRLLGRPLPLVECEPMRWTIRVLECPNGPEEECQPSEERIPLACVPVLQANRDMGEEENFGGGNEQSSSAVIAVPAEPLNENLVPT